MQKKERGISAEEGEGKVWGRRRGEGMLKKERGRYAEEGEGKVC
jgi:hypothetical protein